MLRGTAPRSVLIVGVLALLSSLMLGSRLLSSAPGPEGLSEDVLQVETKLKSSPETHSPRASSPYQPPVQAQQSSSEEPHEAPGHHPSPAAGTTASQRSAGWDSNDEDGDSRGDRDQENDHD